MRTVAFAVGLLAASGCVPDDHPTWLIEHPSAWGLVATVVEPGPYASDLHVPDGHQRAAALPLDTLELQWLEAAPPGSAPLPPPIWLVLTNDLEPELEELAEECPFLLPLSPDSACRLGVGERVRLTLGGAFTADSTFLGRINILAVTSRDPDLDPETCLERLAARPRVGLEQCVIQARQLELGPRWKLLLFVPGFASDYPITGIPPDLASEEADTHPILSSILVGRERDGSLLLDVVQDGDTVHVRRGERITVSPTFTTDSEQSYSAISSSDGGLSYHLVPVREHLAFRGAFTALVDHVERWESDEPVVWTAPDFADPVDLYLYITDQRQGRAHARIRFITEDAGDTAP